MQRELSPGLIFGAAVTCGTFAALAAHILLRGAGIELAAMWRHLAPSNAAEMNAALGWWATAGAGLVGSWIAVVVLKGKPIVRRRVRFLRWLLAAAVVGALAGIGHSGAAPASVAAIHKVAGSFAALALGAVMALCGTHFAMKRRGRAA
jgi:hypothetical protein